MRAFHETHGRVLGRGGNFSDADLPRILIDEGRIGEGAANVYAQPICQGWCSFPRVAL